jgi:hypothetical protein
LGENGRYCQLFHNRAAISGSIERLHFARIANLADNAWWLTLEAGLE